MTERDIFLEALQILSPEARRCWPNPTARPENRQSFGGRMTLFLAGFRMSREHAHVTAAY